MCDACGKTCVTRFLDAATKAHGHGVQVNGAHQVPYESSRHASMEQTRLALWREDAEFDQVEAAPSGLATVTRRLQAPRTCDDFFAYGKAYNALVMRIYIATQ